MKMKDMYSKYLTYIELTGGYPTIEDFDEDWEPIGPTLRRDMESADLIEEVDGRLRVKLNHEDKQL